MELQFLLSLLVVLLVGGVVGVSSALRAKPKKLNLPPGPWQLPVVGSLHHLMMGGGSLPHRRFRDLSKAYGPLMHLRLGEVPMVVASSAEAAREIMKTHDLNFASRSLFHSFDVLSYGGRTLSTAPYGEYWRQLRKFCTMELLSAKRVLSFRPTREEEVRSLIHSISSSSSPSSSTIDLGEKIKSTVNNIAAIAAIGSTYKDQAALIKVMEEIIELVSGFDFADLFPSLSWLRLASSKRRVERAHRNMDEILEAVLNEHQLKKTHHRHDHDHDHEDDDDFVDVLLRPQGDLHFHLTTDGIKAVTMDMFIAGSETASTVLIWAMAELMKNPRVMRRAQSEVRETVVSSGSRTDVSELDMSELSYLQLVIKETLRLHPPGPLLLPRECRKTCEILGYTIPERTRVVVNVWAIGRDPKYWGEDAEEFKPERFEAGTGSGVDFRGTSFEFLPFGAGRRMCPGMSFGMANVELALAQLLYHFDWKLPAGIEPEDFDMSEAFGITACRSSDLCLHATPYIYSTLD